MYTGGIISFRALTLQVRSLDLLISPANADGAETLHQQQPLESLVSPRVFKVPTTARLELHDSLLSVPSCRALIALIQQACDEWAFSPNVQVRVMHASTA